METDLRKINLWFRNLDSVEHCFMDQLYAVVYGPDPTPCTTAKRARAAARKAATR